MQGGTLFYDYIATSNNRTIMKRIFDEKIDPNEPIKEMKQHLIEVSERSNHALLVQPASLIDSYEEVVCKKVR